MWSVLIVGAGPAGLNAAIAAAEQGLDVKVIDEFPKAGGRLLGQLHQEPSGEWWNGIQESERLYNKAVELGVDIQCEVSVYDIDQSNMRWKVYTSAGMMEAQKLLLATGATETPVPIPGWTLPGAISIGAAQVIGNVHRVKPGNSCVIIGANVLSIAIAHELKLCGVQVKEIIIPAANLVSKEAGIPVKVLESLMKLTHLSPTAILRLAGKLGRLVDPTLAIKFFPRMGIKLYGIPIKIKTAAIDIVGDDQVTGVRTVSVTANGEVIKNTEKITDAEFVCIAGDLTPMSELAAIAGCTFKFVQELGGHVPVHSERMQTNVPNLFVAGNITGVESAKVAMAQGKVAGLTIASELKGTWNEMDVVINKAVDEVKKRRAEALIQFRSGIHEARERVYHQFERNVQTKKQQASVS